MNNFSMKHLRRLILISATLSTLSQAAPIADILIRSADIPVDTSSVSPFLSLRKGDEFDRRKVAEDIKTLEKTGRFAGVTAEVETKDKSLTLIYTVKAKPRLREIFISGNDTFTQRTIKKLLELERGVLLDSAVLGVRKKTILDKYRKEYFPNVQISHALEPIGDGRIVDLYLNIKENDRSKVVDIQFTGNTALRNRQLAKVMLQKETWLLSFITGSGTYEPDTLQTDLLSVRDLYRDTGYLEVNVADPTILEKRKGKLNVSIAITEGRIHRVGQIQIQGSSLFPEKDLHQIIGLKTGDLASTLSMETARRLLRDYYTSKGYYQTIVRKQEIADKTKPIVDLLFKIKEGKRTYIRDIEIRGNSRTKDKVIRRELTVFPGDVLNEPRLRTSTARLRNTGFFSYANWTPKPTANPDQVDVVIDLEEKQTGQFSAGAGFSSIENVVGFVELSQGNFDLFGAPRFTGGGQKMRLRAQLGSDSTDAEISFVEPYFFNRRLSLGIDAFQRERRFLSDDYDQKNTGASISLSRPVTRFTRAKLSYQLESIDVFDLADTASDLIREEEGKQTQSSLSLSFTRDTRDSFYISSRGNRARLTGKLAGGPLAFDTDLYEIELRSSQFIPLFFDHVFNVRGYIQSVEEYGDSTRVPIFDRLFLGGARTVRGFDFRDVGPKDETGESIGGKTALYATAEYTLPLIDNFRLAAFYDLGVINKDAWDFSLSDLNSSYGFGIRMDLPAFPLQLDYSWPLETDPFNDRSSGRFSFLIGYFF